MPMEIGEEIVIELQNKDRYTITRQPDAYRLTKNDRVLCFYFESDLISRKLFKFALEEILSVIQDLVK